MLLQVGNAGQALSSALAGLGRAMMPLPLVEEALAAGRLVVLGPGERYEAPAGERLLRQRKRHHCLAEPGERRAQRLPGVADLEQYVAATGFFRVAFGARVARPRDPPFSGAGRR